MDIPPIPPLKPWELNANDKRFLRSLRISAEDPAPVFPGNSLPLQSHPVRRKEQADGYGEDDKD